MVKIGHMRQSLWGTEARASVEFRALIWSVLLQNVRRQKLL